MATKESLRQQAKELENEVVSKQKAFEGGEITASEFAQYMDNAEKINADVQSAMKSYDRASKFAAGSDDRMNDDQQTERKSADAPKSPFMSGKQAAEMYAQMKSRAEVRGRGSFAFDLALKSQGATGLQGENANATTAGSALSDGDYFLSGAAGPDILPQFVPGILQLRWYQNVISDLFPQFPTTSPIVSYVREDSWTNNAAATGEGATKPTSTNAIKRYTEQVGKVSNMVRITDEMLQDDQYFWALVQQRCTMGVTRAEEPQLLAGSGYPGVNGLLGHSTKFTKPDTVTAITNLSIPAASTPGAGTDSLTITSVTPGREIEGNTGVAPDARQIMSGVLSMLTDIRLHTFFEPTAVVMNPNDWFTVRTGVDANGQFYGGSPFLRDYGQASNVKPEVYATDGGLTLWGKRVVTTPALPQGYILVGDFTEGGMVLRRGGLRVEIVNTNGTDFEQGLWTMRADERVGLVVERPELFELAHLVNGS